MRAAVFGLGRIGLGFGVAPDGDPLCHAESYARLPGVEMVLGVDPDPEARARFARRFPTAPAVTAEEARRSEVRIDVASIASSTPAHASSVEIALARGARVLLIEKPLAATSSEAAGLAARCRAAGAIVIVNYSRRWTPMLHAMREALAASGRLGSPLGGAIRYTGGLVHNGTHWIDLLLALLGPSAELADARPGMLRLRFGDCLASLTAMDGVGWSGGEGELWSAAGMLRFADAGQRVTFQRRAPSAWAGFEALAAAEPLVPDGEGLRGHLFEAVKEAVTLARGEGAPSCSADDAIRVLAIAEMAEELAA